VLKLVFALAFFFLLASIVGAAPGAVRCAHLLDVRSGEIRDDRTILFGVDGSISSVVPLGSADRNVRNQRRLGRRARADDRVGSIFD
jgi:hypothetical protein